jgi:DNA-binding NarL/FixJ family response regulator
LGGAEGWSWGDIPRLWGEELLTLRGGAVDRSLRAQIRARLAMSAHPTITVAITRFEDLLALGLQAALEADRSLAIVARDVAPERVRNMLRVHHPRVLLLDVALLRDFAQVREITVEHPETHLVLLGNGLSSVDSAQLLAFGASVCLTTDIEVRDLRHAIHLASRGLQLQLLPTNREIQDTEPLLTPREGDVLALLRQNSSNAQIALTLGIGVETVRSHARNVYRKLGVSSRRTLLAAARGGAVPPPQVVAPPAEPATQLARTRSASLPDVRRPKRRRPEHH